MACDIVDRRLWWGSRARVGAGRLGGWVAGWPPSLIGPGVAAPGRDAEPAAGGRAGPAVRDGGARLRAAAGAAAASPRRRRRRGPIPSWYYLSLLVLVLLVQVLLVLVPAPAHPSTPKHTQAHHPTPQRTLPLHHTDMRPGARGLRPAPPHGAHVPPWPAHRSARGRGEDRRRNHRPRASLHTRSGWRARGCVWSARGGATRLAPGDPLSRTTCLYCLSVNLVVWPPGGATRPGAGLECLAPLCLAGQRAATE